MYISLDNMVYPKPDNIEIVREDVINEDDIHEHCFNVKIYGRIVLSLTAEELDVIVVKGGFALRKEGLNAGQV